MQLRILILQLEKKKEEEKDDEQNSNYNTQVSLYSGFDNLMAQMKGETARAKEKIGKLQSTEWKAQETQREKFKSKFLKDEFGLVATEEEKSHKITDKTWLADSGASIHMTNSDEGMYNIELIESTITIGDGKSLDSSKVGSIEFWSNTPQGRKSFVLHKVKYVPDLCVSLISIPTALQHGMQIGNRGNHLYLKKGNFELYFNKLFKTGRSFVCGIELYRTIPEFAGTAFEKAKGPSVKLTTLHKKLGHCGEESTRKTAKYYEWNATGGFAPCDSCGIAKAKQASVSKETNVKSSIPGERFFMDISNIKAESLGGKKFWLGILDDSTDLLITKFLRGKSQVGETIVEVLQELKVRHNKAAKYIRCDDAGENHKAEEACWRNGFNVQFEYTPPGTPQQNGRIERKFATCYGRIQACYKAAGILEDDLKYKIWAECAMYVTKMDNILVSSTREHSPHFLFYGNHPPFVHSLRRFGEVGIVTYHENKKIRSKLAPRGRPCLFVGYPDDTTGDVYRMIDLETLSLIKTRDVMWLNETYGEYKQRTNPLRDFTIPIFDIDKFPNEEAKKEEEIQIVGTLP